MIEAEPDFDLSLDDFDLDDDEEEDEEFAVSEPTAETAASELVTDEQAPGLLVESPTPVEDVRGAEPGVELELGNEQPQAAEPELVSEPDAVSDFNLAAQESVEFAQDDDFSAVFEQEFEGEAVAEDEALAAVRPAESEPVAYAAQAPANSNEQDYELSDQHFEIELEDWPVEDAQPLAAVPPVTVNAEHGSYEPHGGYDTGSAPSSEAFQAQIPAYQEPLVSTTAEPSERDEQDIEAALAASFEEDLNLDLDDAFADDDFTFEAEGEPETASPSPGAGDLAQAEKVDQAIEPEQPVTLDPEEAADSIGNQPLVTEQPDTLPFMASQPEIEAEDFDFDLAFDTNAEEPELEVASGPEPVSEPEPEPELQAEAIGEPETELAAAPEPQAAVSEPDFEDELAALLAGAAPIAASSALSRATEPRVPEPARFTAPVEPPHTSYEEEQVELSEADFENEATDPEPVEDVSETIAAPRPEPVRAESTVITPPAPEPAKAPVDDDPFAALAAMAARYRASRSASAATPSPQNTEAAQNDDKGTEDAMRTTMQPRTPAPEIETVSVFEQPVALPDDLDIPEMQFEERSAQPQQYDDLDNEFAELLNDMSDNGRVSQQSGSNQQNSASWDDQDTAPRAPQGQDYSGKQYASGYGYAASQQGDLEEDPAWTIPQRDDQYDDYDDELVYEDEQPEERRSILPKPGTLLALLIGGVVLAGGGWFALGSGGVVGSGEPAIIKADATPLKQRPENPGGISVPNQDSKVYERVSGDQTAEEQQASLISTNEAPVDLNSGTDEPITEGLDFDGSDPDVEMMEKSEDRIDEQMADQGVEQSDQGIAIAPHKVKTMVVKADGTLAPAGDDTPAAAGPVVEPAVNAARAALQRTQEGSQAANVASAEQTGSIAAIAADDAPAQAENTAPTQVAAVAPGAWAIQLASVPSEAAAKSTYDGLSKKYGSVLGGRGVNIVKAEVAGKGTFYRVRVPTQTRDEAVQLCTNLKSAGGSCFVSK
ncbi:SPOR domain-containing protein [Mesorhizobium liriopis]|uniref:SPOR domain-containing protein n=1 Tax=Mesorhizobium liriopis TaxID=2953882 RepID=UPI0020924C2E